MNWSQQVPSEPGYYWHWLSGALFNAGPVMVELARYGGSVYFQMMATEDDWSYPSERFERRFSGGWWMGPLAAPVTPISQEVSA